MQITKEKNNRIKKNWVIKILLCKYDIYWGNEVILNNSLKMYPNKDYKWMYV